MVGIVIVSHSETLARGVVELMTMMTGNVQARAAGGLGGGALGTSFKRIFSAVNEVETGDGCAIFMDLGSSVMTSEMVVEAFASRNVRLFDAPLVEGAVLAAIEAAAGKNLDEIERRMKDARTMRKMNG
jgi:dihydroxyacetone kinase, phosphotransfer subunit